MNHEHVYTTFVRTLPDGRDVVRCGGCPDEKTVVLAKTKAADHVTTEIVNQVEPTGIYRRGA